MAILYKDVKKELKRERPIKHIQTTIEEKPERPVYVFRNNRDRAKFIKQIEAICRRSMEYKEYMAFLKSHCDMRRCAVLKNLDVGNGKRYSIEIHHEPFKLYDIVDTVIRKWESMGEPLNPFLIADEVMELHYDEKVGLIPLTKTMHELVGNDKIFIPLQLIYHKYDKFYDEYEPYMTDELKELVQLKAELSIKAEGHILSDTIDPEFTYVDIEGFNFPEIPEEWKSVLQALDTENRLNSENK